MKLDGRKYRHALNTHKKDKVEEAQDVLGDPRATIQTHDTDFDSL